MLIPIRSQEDFLRHESNNNFLWGLMILWQLKLIKGNCRPGGGAGEYAYLHSISQFYVRVAKRA